MKDLQYFKNDITLILSKDRLATYDSLEQYKENLKLIASITPKISNLEIYLRNALDHCLTQIKGSDWVFNESALTPLIKELKEKKKEITHSLILSKMSLGAVVRLIFCYKLEGVILDLKRINFKSYYPNNKNTLFINNKKNPLSGASKVHIALNLLWTIRNRAYHWENLLKIQPNNRPRITTYFTGLKDNDRAKMPMKINISVEPSKIVLFLDDLIKSIGNKDLENLSGL
ncbi:CAAX protease [Helicobacter pylori]|uniref:CAAX protease n=1 Tax=Helicobacter pylori TaxID=210 RepID=UPI0009A2BCB5|nr:CAAX protease [Helicobacter pylori]MBH0277619.1 CAAX protease [Helicobacter pylori]NHA17268.1 CAAX protease [Helicobacter pylori]OPG38383.1 CAAX protease [Helicobacter pylori]OPG63255.1 CAAX protease [Helicobacter pylori]WRC56331.1 CAAX protease [Helicobacter pylori]